jgi:hypothetical protein
LIAYGIERRASGPGLANRGIAAPTAGELDRMLNVERIGYQGVAALYGVHPTAVGYWCKRLGIQPPTVQESRYGVDAPIIPPVEELAALYAEGLNLREIGERYGVSRLPIVTRLKAAGIAIKPDGFSAGKRFPCTDGHKVRSTYERRVDDWLSEHGIPHVYEPQLPWDLRSHADFLATGYRAHGAPLIEINAEAFTTRTRGRWQRRLAIIESPPVHPGCSPRGEGQLRLPLA